MAKAFPWIAIPHFPQDGQPYAFVDREEQIARLYKEIVAAGNALRASRDKGSARLRCVVSGYMGVGKSALIFQVLGMLRDPLGVVEGQNLELPPGLPEPQDRERWLILRASGKSVPSVAALADELRKSVLSTLDDIGQEAERKVPEALKLGLFHRLFSREKKLYAEVRSALRTFSLMIEYVRIWEGATQQDKLEKSVQTDTGRMTDATIEGLLKKTGADPGASAEGKAALKLAVNFIRKSALKSTTSVERQVIVNADLVVDALNGFFAATEKAGLPTILVLDDFDEFASGAGPSHADRAQVLANVLGTFNRLAPTCLLIALRQEYMHEDLRRQFQRIHVPPMDRQTALKALDAWSRVQQPALDDETTEALRVLGDRLLEPFEQSIPVVVPYPFLQIVAWLANNTVAREESAYEMLLRYVRGNLPFDVARTVLQVVERMPEDDILACASAGSLDGESYQLKDRERHALVKEGLLRPAMAGDPHDTSILLDPLFAYLRAARTQAS